MCVEVNKEGLSGIGLDLNASPLLFNLQNSDNSDQVGNQVQGMILSSILTMS